MNIILNVSDSLAKEILQYQQENDIQSFDAAYSDLLRIGLLRVRERAPDVVIREAMAKLASLEVGTHFSVHDLAPEDSPTARKLLGRHLAAEAQNSRMFFRSHNTQQGLTIYMRTEYTDAPQLS